MNMLAKYVCGSVVSFVVSELCVLIVQQFMHLLTKFCALRICEWSEIYNLIKKSVKTKLKNLLSFISINLTYYIKVC